MKKIVITAFILIAFIQWLVPGLMIFDRHTVLTKGTAYRFRTQPLDPVNPFKGRYVALSFAENSFQADSASQFRYGQDIFVELTTSDSGYAKVLSVRSNAPSSKNGYVKATVSHFISNEKGIHMGFIKYPFEEYYMEEFDAPRAESLYREAVSDSTKQTYAIVKVYKGEAVLQDLVINSRPVKDLLREKRSK